MTLREKVIAARKAYESGQIPELFAILEKIEDQLESIGTVDRNNPPIALCCFYYEKGLIRCGDKNIIFTGTPEQRREFCPTCFDLCRKEYERLKSLAKGGKDAGAN